MKYILISQYGEYRSDGGENIETFSTEIEMHERANKLLLEPSTEILFAGAVQTEWVYEEVRTITDYKPKVKP